VFFSCTLGFVSGEVVFRTRRRLRLGDWTMFDVAVSWCQIHPLQTVAAMAGFAVLIGLLLLPALHHDSGQHHPRV